MVFEPVFGKSSDLSATGANDPASRTEATTTPHTTTDPTLRSGSDTVYKMAARSGAGTVLLDSVDPTLANGSTIIFLKAGADVSGS